MTIARADLIGAIDQGTTGTRFMVFDRAGRAHAMAYKEHRQHYPEPGWVEHDPEEILANTLEVMVQACAESDIPPERLAAIGVTNQRETVVVWDADTGRPLHNTLVWQDRRTADRCRALVRDGAAEAVRAKTGLPVDPYFSATKLEWLLDNVPGLRARANAGMVRFGTIDTWLLSSLAGVHVTDPTNASRTLLYDIHRQDWDPELLDLFHIPRSVLPGIMPSAAVYGVLEPARHPVLRQAWGGRVRGIPMAGDLGDQQAALFGQAGYAPGEMKVTVGTGSFLLRHTGAEPVVSRHGLLTTIAYALPGRPACYALEGSIFITGAAVQWLRDGLGIIASAAETQALAESVPDTGGVYFVPAFAGLGAPHWNTYARGTLVGITGGAGRAHIARATLEAIAYQTRDVIEAMANDSAPDGAPARPAALRMDGGAVKNDFLCQFQADVLGIPVIRPEVEETTSLGAAFAAGLAVGFWSGVDELRRLWRPARTFEPRLAEGEREHLYAGWRRAVRAALSWAAEEK